ncbi:MAG: single-stranded DNA-binding protein, partial [Patescibacteria group bacterium]
MNLNKAFVLGNVTRDPEVRALPSGQQVASFGLATNRFYTDAQGQKKQDVEFHNIVTFGKLADIASRYLNKGSLVLIEGRIKTRNWQNAQGVKQY